MEIQRWDCSEGCIVRCEDGKWVRYDDYAALAQELDDLREHDESGA
jgi:hypothetical protein